MQEYHLYRKCKKHLKCHIVRWSAIPGVLPHKVASSCLIQHSSSLYYSSTYARIYTSTIHINAHTHNTHAHLHIQRAMETNERLQTCCVWSHHLRGFLKMRYMEHSLIAISMLFQITPALTDS